MKITNLPEDAVIADGFDDAIIGITTNGIVAYSYKKCIKILVNQGMELDEAVEYFEYNVDGAYVGENTPIYIHQ